MTRYSYIIIDPLSSFGPGDRLQGVLSVLRDCGYSGVELNFTEADGSGSRPSRGVALRSRSGSPFILDW